MHIEIDPNATLPPYEQVRSEIARQINDGELAVGTKLAAVRKFADELGVAPNTIARAYRELEEVGLLETKGRAGTFVGSSGDESRQRAREAASEYATITRGLGLSSAEALEVVRAALES
jgi:DNA-binding transcriptional regulator YhcF (GntR family)